jgi:hypothetical protein
LVVFVVSLRSGRAGCQPELTANPYLRRLVPGWKLLGLERSLGSRIVTCADVIQRSEKPSEKLSTSIDLGKLSTVRLAEQEK